MNHAVGARLKEYTGTAINTGADAYAKIFATGKEAPSQQGAIEQQLNELFDFLEAYRQCDIFLQEGRHQLKSLNFFSGLRKYRQEVLASLVHKYRAMLLRNEPQLDTVWGTKWNIEHALRMFFNNSNCFVMEYTNEQKNNAVSDEFTVDTWTLDGTSLEDDSDCFTEEAALFNIKAIRLDSNKRLQTKKLIRLKKGVYSLHFFIRGQTVKDEKRYGAVELAITDIFTKQYTCDASWMNIQEFIYITEEEKEVTLTFSGVHPCDIDFVCLYPAVNYPSISILVGNGGMRNKQSMFFAPGQKDVILDVSGNIAQYFEPPYRGTHSKYKFWFAHGDDTDAQAKKERKEKKITFDDPKWGYWSGELAALDIIYLNMLIDALIPVGVRVFGLLMSRRGT